MAHRARPLAPRRRGQLRGRVALQHEAWHRDVPPRGLVKVRGPVDRRLPERGWSGGLAGWGPLRGPVRPRPKEWEWCLHLVERVALPWTIRRERHPRARLLCVERRLSV